MVSILIRNVSPEVQRALEIRAAEHNQSTEAEIHSILQEAVQLAPEVKESAPPIKIGSELAAFGRKWGIKDFHVVRDSELPEPAIFE